MLDYDPIKNLQHYPIPMKRFGVNPYGDPLYRIVRASSRRNLAAPPDGAFRWIRTYPSLGDIWVLEKWHTPWEYCQMSRERWDREKASLLGPFPDRGEYALCEPLYVPPTDCNLEKLIAWIEAGKKTSFQDNLDAVKSRYDAEDRAKRSMAEAITRNVYPAFGANAMSSSLVSRGTKHQPDLKSANELGLPVGNNKFQQLRKTA